MTTVTLFETYLTFTSWNTSRTTFYQRPYLPAEKLEPDIIFDDDLREIIEKNGGKVTVEMVRAELDKQIEIYTELAGLETDSA